MADTSTVARITKILTEHLGVTESQVLPDTLLVPEGDRCGRVVSARANLGADSLDVIEIVMALEDEFRIGIPDDAVEALQKAAVRDLVAFVDRSIVAAA